MYTFSPDNCHTKLIQNIKPALAFDPTADYSKWKEQVRFKLDELLGDKPEAVDLNVTVEWEKETDTYTERYFVFDTEDEASVPCHLLIPKTGKAPYPVVICLQGHSSGMHISLGRPVFEGDEETISGGDRDFARQIIREGYAALVIEQRGFGKRVCNPERDGGRTSCAHPSMVALLLGRSMLRERAWDVSRAIDAIEAFSEIDMEHIAMMGNSGGGTATYYTACVEPRIKVAMPSCSVCAFDHSIGIMRHCDCNYLPRMIKYFDMGELACLIAPRPLIVVAGQKDNGFLIDGVHKVYNVIEQIYEKEGVPENCKLIVGPEGHRFYADLSWGVFREMFLGK